MVGSDAAVLIEVVGGRDAGEASGVSKGPCVQCVGLGVAKGLPDWLDC